MLYAKQGYERTSKRCQGKVNKEIDGLITSVGANFRQDTAQGVQ